MAPSVLRSLLVVAVFAAALVGVVGWIYAPGINGPALLDDHSSVLVTDPVVGNPEQAMDYVFGDRSGPLGRSLSMASFVAERLWFGNDLSVSKTINIALHALNSLLVFALYFLLLSQAKLPRAIALAGVAATAWALSPLWVSTVLYVVQRMAMLATTCMLLSMLLYVVGRGPWLSVSGKILAFVGALCFAVLGPFAKENAVLVIPVLVLLELLWFQCRNDRGDLLPSLQRWALGLMCGGAAVVLGYLTFNWNDLAAAYSRRPFDLEERLLTQPRLLWDYLGQLLWPNPLRMGIYHDDVVVSRSLINPSSTLWSLIAWGNVLLAGGIAVWFRAGRWLVLGGAIWLVGHAMESSVWPLELYFEHRAYFPGVGVFLLLATGLGLLGRQWPEMLPPLLILACLGVVYLSSQTGMLARVWSQRDLLIMHHIAAHPTSARANTDMAVRLAQLGQWEGAQKYSDRAFASNPDERSADVALRDIALGCIAGRDVGNDQVARIGEEDPERPVASLTTLLTLVRMIQDDRCPELDKLYFADHMASLFLVDEFRKRAAPNIYFSLAVLENALQRFDYAYRYTSQYLSMLPNNTRGQLMQLHFATALGKVQVAEQMIAALQAKQAAGELNVGEQQTLALYTEQPF